MAQDFNVANLRGVLGRIESTGRTSMQRTLAAVALAGEKQGKINARNGAHKRGTPTPARKPHGPAVISGNLRRNITHEPVRRAGNVYTSRVGVASGAPYGKHVEKLGFRFMSPLVGFLTRTIIPQVARRQFRRGNYSRGGGRG